MDLSDIIYHQISVDPYQTILDRFLISAHLAQKQKRINDKRLCANV